MGNEKKKYKEVIIFEFRDLIIKAKWGRYHYWKKHTLKHKCFKLKIFIEINIKIKFLY